MATAGKEVQSLLGSTSRTDGWAGVLKQGAAPSRSCCMAHCPFFPACSPGYHYESTLLYFSIAAMVSE